MYVNNWDGWKINWYVISTTYYYQYLYDSLNSQIQAYILLSVLIVFSNTQTAIINIISEVRTAYVLMSYLFIVISIGDSSTYLLYTIIDIGDSCDSKNINLCTIISTNYISNSHLLLLWLLLPTRYVIPRSI